MYKFGVHPTALPSSLLKRYAWFEDPAAPPPAPPTPPPATPPEPDGGNGGEDEEKPIMSTARLHERLERERAAERKKLYAELGIEDPTADAELLKSARQQREASQSEVEKAQAAKAAAEKTAADLKTQLEQERLARLHETRDRALERLLTAQKVKSERLSALLNLLNSDHADALAKATGDDGTLDEKALGKVADEARKAYPEWFGSGGVGSPSLTGGKPAVPDLRKLVGEKPFGNL